MSLILVKFLSRHKDKTCEGCLRAEKIPFEPDLGNASVGNGSSYKEYLRAISFRQRAAFFCVKGGGGIWP
jgi:hypothetical protein